MPRLSAILLACLFLQAPSRTFAWWDLGHMTVAAVAYDKLDPAVRAKIGALLKLNPDYWVWIQGVPADEQERAAFIHAATWSDDIKGRHDYARNSIEHDGPNASLNIGYGDHLAHDYWHFVDTPYAVDGAQGRPAPEPNALNEIRLFLKTLAGDASDDVKSYDVVWLLHLVGDVHQPLHTVSRFSRKMPQGDRGGNDEQVCLAFTCGAALHAFWDGLLGNKGSAADAYALANGLASADAAAAADLNPEDWVKESSDLARKSVYTEAVGDGTGPFTLDQSYQDAARQLARAQVALAGARLAGVLNWALGGAH